MNTPSEITTLDLLRLATAEFKRYERHAECGDYEMFDSARLTKELVREAIEVAESNT